MIINILYWENSHLVSHIINDHDVEIFDNIHFEEFRKINDLSNYKISLFKKNNTIFEIHKKIDITLLNNVFSKLSDPLSTSVCILSSISNPPLSIRDKLTKIQKINCHLMHCINELKIFLDLQYNKLKIDNSTLYPVNNLYTEIYNLFKYSFNERKNKLTFKHDIPELYFDFNKVLQIMTSIVKNANEYTYDGVISIHITHYTEQTHRSSLCPFPFEDIKAILFKIKNNGSDLEENTQNYLNNIFNITNDTYQNANFGFGLIIAYQLCRLFKGKIWFINPEDMGVGFFFYLIMTD